MNPHLSSTKILNSASGVIDVSSAGSAARGVREAKLRVKTQTLSGLPLLKQKTSPLYTYLVDQ